MRGRLLTRAGRRLRRFAVRVLGFYVRRARALARRVLVRTRPARVRVRWVLSRLRVGPVKAVGVAGAGASTLVMAAASGSTVVALVHLASIAAVLAAVLVAVRLKQRPPLARPVVAGMASIPERESTLRLAVASLIGQVDRLYVYLNRYETVPAFLASDKIVVLRSQDHGDLADNGKFFGLRYHRSGIFFAVDDDIVYPPDYVQRMVRALRSVRYRAIVGVHGVVYPRYPRSFLNRRVLSYLRANPSLRPVSLLGTGTVAFSIRHVKLSLDVFRTSGMADVWLATYAKDHRIPMLAVPRRRGWLIDADLPATSPRLWRDSKNDHRLQSSAIVDAEPWGLDDLVDRVQRSSLTGRLPADWARFVAFHSVLHSDGADAAVHAAAASATSGATLGENVALYCEPKDILAAAGAALRWEGHRGELFRRTARAAAGHHAAAAAGLLEQAAGQAREQRDDAAVAELACQASAAYRACGDLRSAERVLNLVPAGHRDDRAVRVEAANLCLDRRRYGQARDLLVPGAPGSEREPGQLYLLAYTLAHAESVTAAAPLLADLFLDRNASRLQRKLVSGLRDLGPVTGLRALPAFRDLERACREGRVDPLPLLHLYLALGDRPAAADLLRTSRDRVAGVRPDYLPWLEAAVAQDFTTVVDHLNRGFADSGFLPLSVEREDPRVSPLAWLRGGEPGAAGDAPVTVVVTAYNCADTLPYALESILRQTVRVAEILVVDDASTDGTPEVVSAYAARDDRVVPVRSATNSGPYACRNLALAKAAGEYIAFHDSDDYAHPQRLEHQLGLLADGDAVACYTSHVRVSDRGAVVLENNGEIVGEGPATLVMHRRVLDDIGYFLPIRSRGDIEHRGRMLHYYGAHRVVFDRAVLLLARDAPTTNSRRFEQDAAGFESVLRLRAEAAWRHQSSDGRREALYVGADAPYAGSPGP